MCTLYPRYNSCCGIPVRIALIFIAILSIVTGAMINAMLKKAGVNVSSIQDVKILKNLTGFKFQESNDTLLSSRRENEYVDVYEDVQETSSWKSRRAQYEKTTTKDEYITIEIIGEDGQIEVLRFVNEDQPEGANAPSEEGQYEDKSADQDQSENSTPPPPRATTQVGKGTTTTHDSYPDQTTEDSDPDQTTPQKGTGSTRPLHGSTTKQGAWSTRPPHGSTTKKGAGSTPPPPRSTTQVGAGTTTTEDSYPDQTTEDSDPDQTTTKKGAGSTQPPHGSTTKKGADSTRPPHGSTTKKGAGSTRPPHGSTTKKGAGSKRPSHRRTTAEGAGTTAEGAGTTAEVAGTTAESDESGETTPEESEESTPEESGESTPEESGESTTEESGETTPEESGETTPDSTEETGGSTTTKLPTAKNITQSKSISKESIFKAVGYVNRNGMNLLAMMFIALGILLLVANFLNSPDLALLYVVLLIATIIAALVLLVGVLTECSTYHDICILKRMDWFSSFMVTIFWFIYIFIWAFFAAVANTFANGGVGQSFL